MRAEGQLKALVAALRAWTQDPSNVNWKPVQKILDGLKDSGEVGPLAERVSALETERND
jgi:hypothetical protein